MITKAFAPANISCIFKIYNNKDPKKAGSLGLGFTLNEGVTVTAKKSRKNKIIFNGKTTKLPTVNFVVKNLTKTPVEIKLKSKLPLSCGFGLSGASALATAYALNKLFNLKKSKKELAMLAHESDVINKSGLGDVVNQFYGGMLVKFVPSSRFIVNRLNIRNKKIYCRYFSKLDTKSIISSKKKMRQINNAASKSLQEVKKIIKTRKPHLKSIVRISKDFSMNSGLLKNKNTIDTIKNIEKNNGNASMIMLGNAVFSDKKFKGSKEYKITNKGAHLIK